MAKQQSKVPIKGFGNLPDDYGKWMIMEWW